MGSYVVAPPTDGYEVVKDRRLAPFRPAWLPERQTPEAGREDVEEWEVIPEGRRNDTLTAFAGFFRRQGMAPKLIFQVLQAFNESIVEQGSDPITTDELETIVRSVSRYAPQPDWSIEVEGAPTPLSELDLGDVLELMSEMQLPPPAEWYWKPYLPKGRLVLLDGSEGIGKGLLCVYIATRLTTEGVPVLWASTEDDPEEDIQRRLLAAGYKRGHHAEIGFFKVDPRFPADTDAFERIVREFGAGLVILDPGRSFLAPPEGVKTFSFNDEVSIRPGLQALNRLAKRTGCTIVFVHHWNKNTQTTVQYRSSGSGAFAQVVRHRITAAWFGPTEGGQGAFEVGKSNIGPKGHVHSYTVEPDLHYDTARFELGEPMPEYSDLGAWLKTMEKEADGIELDLAEQITDDIVGLAGGAPVPAVAELQKRYGIKRSQAQELITTWLSEGLVRRGARKKLFRVGEHERASPQ
jgi:KaiC/GvpD/RAD55 family RecA-like ATPase